MFTVTPMSIFAQNNGVIALTRCANRKAGFACSIFLIIFGVLGKISGVFLSIPNPVYVFVGSHIEYVELIILLRFQISQSWRGHHIPVRLGHG